MLSALIASRQLDLKQGYAKSVLGKLRSFCTLRSCFLRNPEHCRIAEPQGIAIIGHVPEGFPELAWPLKTSSESALIFPCRITGRATARKLRFELLSAAANKVTTGSLPKSFFLGP